ncbi:MAG: hypothetical protein Q7R76_04790 [Candidatus Woesearchaeota archaeon]|nr:hypothetical protein [Candidatus Woesearchaeota archaeon]
MPFPKKEGDEPADSERMQRLEQRESQTEEKVQKLQEVLKNVEQRQQQGKKYAILKLLIRAGLLTAPLWVLFLLSLKTDVTLYLSVWGIALVLLLYFGTLGLYLYARYLKKGEEQ